MHSPISSITIPDANPRVEEHAFGGRERVVGVDEAAFGGFEVGGGEGVGGDAEGERPGGGGGCEGGGGEGDCVGGEVSGL